MHGLTRRRVRAVLASAVGAVAAVAVTTMPATAFAAPGDPVRDGGTTVETVPDLPAFEGRVMPLTAAERRRMTGPVWRRGCPVALGALRAVRASHVGFDGEAHEGVLVVHRARAAGVLAVLRRLYDQGFPIRRMHPIERYGGSDDRLIEADNTSAFNCRRVTGGSGWSEHAYGRAIDLNPIENPYIHRDGTTSHKASRPYLVRDDVRPGMAVRGSLPVTAFAARGWKWGGLWTAPVDTQHFSTTGR